MKVKRQAGHGWWLAVALSALGCTSTQRHATEYDQAYYLAGDVHLYTGHVFTSTYAAWFTGPQPVLTMCPASIPVAGARQVKKGAPVRVRRLFTVKAPDAGRGEAELQLVDAEAGTTDTVYVQWPYGLSLLTTATPER